jgi:hypothetical protein
MIPIAALLRSPEPLLGDDANPRRQWGKPQTSRAFPLPTSGLMPSQNRLTLRAEARVITTTEASTMVQDDGRAILSRGIAAALFVALVSVALPQGAIARDGVSGCSISEVETDAGKVWRYTIELLVPQGGHCRVYVGEDKDRKSWNYCWLKSESDNPVVATCDDALDDPDFDNWKVKAACGDQNFMAYCRRERKVGD